MLLGLLGNPSGLSPQLEPSGEPRVGSTSPHSLPSHVPEPLTCDRDASQGCLEKATSVRIEGDRSAGKHTGTATGGPHFLEIISFLCSYHELGGLTEIDAVLVLEARSPKSVPLGPNQGIRRFMLPLEALRQGSPNPQVMDRYQYMTC